MATIYDRLDCNRIASHRSQASILTEPSPTTSHDTTATSTIMGPYIFFRVEDEDSRARYSGEEGLFGGYGHLGGWFQKLGNRVPTPFISMYCDEVVAHREAKRHVGEGKKDVRVYKINTRRSDERRGYRNNRLLAERLDFDIPECAWNNSEYEYIFLHHVSDSAVVGWIDHIHGSWIVEGSLPR